MSASDPKKPVVPTVDDEPEATPMDVSPGPAKTAKREIKMLSRFQTSSLVKPDRPNSAIKIHLKNQKIEADFYQRKLHEKVVMDSEDSEFWSLFEDFMKIQKNQLSFLKIQFDENSIEDVTKDEILRKLENVLKESSKPIKIKRLFLEVSNSNQAISILKNLDSQFMGKLEIAISNSDQKIDIDGFKFLLDWKQINPSEYRCKIGNPAVKNKQTRLRFVLKLDKIFEENLKSINRLFLNWPIFTEIGLIYKDFELNPKDFFDVPFRIRDLENSEHSINFRVNSRFDSDRFRFAPSVVKLALSTEKARTVLENPVIMEKIVKYFKLFDIQRLRRTSSGILACLNDLKPDPRIEEYLMFVRSEEFIEAEVSVGDYRSRKNIPYKKAEDSDEMVSRVLKDFEMNFKNQKTCMDEFKLIFSYCDQTEPFAKEKTSASESESLKTLIVESLNPMTSKLLDGFQKVLENRTEPLKVRKLDLMSVRPFDVMQILPYLDSKSLNSIKIQDPYSEYSRLFNRRKTYPTSLKVPFDIEEIAKTEQWRNAKELEVHTVPISTPVKKMNLTGFSKMFLDDIQQITSEDVAYLKENLLSSSNLKRYIISFKEFVGRENLYDHIGHPTRIYTEDRKLWYFRLKEDKKNYLEIDLGRDIIYFERVWGMRYVP